MARFVNILNLLWFMNSLVGIVNIRAWMLRVWRRSGVFFSISTNSYILVVYFFLLLLRSRSGVFFSIGTNSDILVVDLSLLLLRGRTGVFFSVSSNSDILVVYLWCGSRGGGSMSTAALAIVSAMDLFGMLINDGVRFMNNCMTFGPRWSSWVFTSSVSWFKFVNETFVTWN